MSYLQYNGISLPYAHTERFEVKAVLDDYSRTDKIVTQFDVSVQCIVCEEALDMLAPELAGKSDNPALIMAWIQEQLLIPRKKLSFVFNGMEYIPQPAGVKGFVDAMNGPKPQSCTIVPMGDGAWLMTYRIIAHYVIGRVGGLAGAQGFKLGTNPTLNNLPGNVVLYNRWDESVSMDPSQYSTRTRKGKFMIRSDNDAGLLADELRSQMAAVSVPVGFTRRRSDYTVSPDGLAVSYLVVDREEYMMPPSPAYEADGQYEEGFSRGDGKRFATATCSLRGAKNVSQSRLAQVAAGVVFNRLNQASTLGPAFDLVGSKLPKQVILESASYRIWTYDNRVQVTARVLLANPNRKPIGLNMINFSVVDQKPKGSDQQGPAIPYTARGTASLLMRAAAHWDNTIALGRLGPEDPTTTINPRVQPAGQADQNVPGKEVGTLGVNP